MCVDVNPSDGWFPADVTWGWLNQEVLDEWLGMIEAVAPIALPRLSWSIV